LIGLSMAIINLSQITILNDKKEIEKNFSKC
jgi:hypothetical protein